MDLGAGPGTLTGPLAETGARVLAVEREPAFVARLHTRFADHPNVRVVEGDLRSVPLPRRPFQVVASIPFALSTTLFRRLLQPARTAVSSADLVVEWGFAKRVSQPLARDLEAAWWGARFELTVVRRIPAAMFAPAPGVDCAHLAIRPRPGMGRRRTLHALYALLAAAYRAPGRSVRDVVGEVVPKRQASGVVTAARLASTVVDHRISVAQWAELATLVPDVASPHWPALPRQFDEGRPPRRR